MQDHVPHRSMQQELLVDFFAERWNRKSAGGVPQVCSDVDARHVQRTRLKVTFHLTDLSTVLVPQQQVLHAPSFTECDVIVRLSAVTNISTFAKPLVRILAEQCLLQRIHQLRIRDTVNLEVTCILKLRPMCWWPRIEAQSGLHVLKCLALFVHLPLPVLQLLLRRFHLDVLCLKCGTCLLNGGLQGCTFRDNCRASLSRLALSLWQSARSSNNTSSFSCICLCPDSAASYLSRKLFSTSFTASVVRCSSAAMCVIRSWRVPISVLFWSSRS